MHTNEPGRTGRLRLVFGVGAVILGCGLAAAAKPSWRAAIWPGEALPILKDVPVIAAAAPAPAPAPAPQPQRRAIPMLRDLPLVGVATPPPVTIAPPAQPRAVAAVPSAPEEVAAEGAWVYTDGIDWAETAFQSVVRDLTARYMMGDLDAAMTLMEVLRDPGLACAMAEPGLAEVAITAEVEGQWIMLDDGANVVEMTATMEGAEGEMVVDGQPIVLELRMVEAEPGQTVEMTARAATTVQGGPIRLQLVPSQAPAKK